MTRTARRDGTPERDKNETFYISYAKPAKKQHVQRPEPHPLEDNWWDDEETKTRKQNTEGVRLQKVLAQAGVASRRHAEVMIAQGRVSVNGKRVTVQGMRVDPDRDVIRVDGTRINVNEKLEYFAFNKPRGVHTTMKDELDRTSVGSYLSERTASGQRLFHVGRLDADTEGLLLLTNDGELANRLTHPKYEVSKTYLATVLGEAKPALVKELKEGIMLDDGLAKADYAQIVDVHNGQSLIRLELHEGRKHIVRRMLKAAGFPVQRLVRTKVHTVQLGDMKPGSMRALNAAELTSLYNAVEM
ncbi:MULTISPECIES: pseudouridine synthase [Corynebacterium]|uniref:pseudouridine synthase n=1 Tax=Corynebacterium TaxID=1716 RepID=UPI0008A4979B|nr:MULTISPECIES: pseudouridine synthase [Corynebacterium]MDK7179643.1 pseudouridine synthase [Corynebacterium riegelii]OFT75765.1 MFS transporter [Corynebacterium sp. HMSC30G07]PLA13559.1 rRNA pseudouridine synthase [Corynebacterium riegelii]QQU83524.1 rRNA pseudouridine synthase [Corynebacterium riegelii]